MKHLVTFNSLQMLSVAPRAGAWIETQYTGTEPVDVHVAPRAGAWIETNPSPVTLKDSVSRPPRGGVD